MSHTIYKWSKVSTRLLETRKLQISLRYIYHYYKIMGLWKDTIPLFCITCVHQQRLHTLIYYIYIESQKTYIKQQATWSITHTFVYFGTRNSKHLNIFFLLFYMSAIELLFTLLQTSRISN